MAQASDCKRLVASIVKFLKDEVGRDGVTPDMQESIEVARQCLEMAYAIDDSDVPKDQKNLVDLFVVACPAPPPMKELSLEDKESAEKHKQQGNDFMKTQNFEEAIAAYTKAIEIDPQNAVYFCNRAAAHTGKQSFESSLKDCKKALEIDSKYSKAYSRMGLTYSKMEIYDEAILCYKKALELDPNNEGYKKNMEIAQEKKRQQANSVPAGMGGFGKVFENPAFMNMAKQVMENPAMQQMAMNLMGNFSNQGHPQGDAGDSSGQSSNQVPDFQNIMQMGQQFAQQLSQENPELVEELRGQMQNQNPTSDEKSG